MRRRFLLMGITLVLLLATACATSGNRTSTESLNPVAPVDDGPAAAMTFGSGFAYDESSGEQDVDLVRQDGEPLQARVVLKNAVMAIVVDDVDAKIAEITALAAQYEGWVVNAQVTRARVGEANNVAYGSITVRVDAARLDEVLALIKEGVSEVESESVTGQDVTQDYVDLTGQVANLEAAERQLQEIMSSATKTEDVLSVYNELVRVRGEIETLRGRLNYYDEASRTSSIQISLRPTAVLQPVEIGGWRPLETARDAFQMLVNLLQNVADVAITVAIVGLPLALVVLVAVTVFRRRRRVVRAAGE